MSTEDRNTKPGRPPTQVAAKLVVHKRKGDGRIAFSAGTVTQKANRTWFRGDNCNFNPAIDDVAVADAVQRYVLHGWTPARPLIGPETKLVAFGSCFAANIANWLAKRNFNILTDKEGPNRDAYVVRFGEGMVNTFVIRQQFEWAFEGKAPVTELWHGYDTESFGYDENVRRRTREIFDDADVFILTFGLSEVWYDEPTGGVFWRAVPEDKYDPARHKFRVSTAEENRDNIDAIVGIIKKHRPNATVIMTLSPIPLVATFRPVSCVTANQVSKAILRCAIDEVVRARGGQGVYYWPSYEIAMDFFENRWEPDRRHIKTPILDYIMTLFESVWCHGTAPEVTLTEAALRARAAEGSVTKSLYKVIQDRFVDGIRYHFGKVRNPAARAVVQAYLDEKGIVIPPKPPADASPKGADADADADADASDMPETDAPSSAAKMN